MHAPGSNSGSLNHVVLKSISPVSMPVCPSLSFVVHRIKDDKDRRGLPFEALDQIGVALAEPVWMEEQSEGFEFTDGKVIETLPNVTGTSSQDSGFAFAGRLRAYSGRRRWKAGQTGVISERLFCGRDPLPVCWRLRDWLLRTSRMWSLPARST